MARGNLLDRIEQQLERILEDPFLGAAPFDVRELKRRLLSAVAEAGTSRVPDEWYIRLPASLQEHDAEVRAWVEALWRSLVTSLDAEGSRAAGTSPRIHLDYDPNLAGSQMMVGYDFRSNAIPPPPVERQQPKPTRRKRGHPVFWLARLMVVGALVGVIAVLVLGPAAAPTAAAWRPSLPALPNIKPNVSLPDMNVTLPDIPGVDTPSLRFAQTRYVTQLELHVRSEPSTAGEIVRSVPAGHSLSFGEHNIVRGESVRGEDRWVNVTPLVDYLKGERMYVWYGGLSPE